MSFKRLIIYFNIIAIVFIGIVFFFGHTIEMYWFSKQKVEKEQIIFIPTGSSLENVIQLLVKEGVIDNTTLFQELAQQKNYIDKNVVAGKYKVESYFSINHLINNLRAGRGALQVRITLNNIRTLSNLLERIDQHIEPTQAEFKTYFNDSTIYQKYGFTADNFLTLFISDTYYFKWNTSVAEFTQRMYQEYQEFWTEERKEKAEKIGLSLEEVTVLASIVKAEQEIHKDEQPIIAGLYINRLQQNMRLQADPTVKYAANDKNIKRVLNKHLLLDHPYNTYRNKGLPPGPINLPEKHVIDAVLNYRKHNYVYMCAVPGYSGKHVFASSFSAHQKNAKEYSMWLNKQGIK